MAAKRGGVDEDRVSYMLSHQSPLHPIQIKLIEATQAVPEAIMLSSTDQVQLLCNMLQFAGAKKVLDIGVYTGYSALSWALALPEDGKVIACDVSTQYTDVGEPFWREAGVRHKIDLRIAPAAETLSCLLNDGEAGTFDFAYIDADKTGEDSYYELALKLLRPNGIIAIDNVWFFGTVIDPNLRVDWCSPEGSAAIRALNAKIKSDDRVQAVMIDTGDGMFVCRKK